MLLKVQAAFSAFKSSLHIPNRYSTPILRPLPRNPQAALFHNARKKTL